jgi:pyruvate dehydrogenase E1 component
VLASTVPNCISYDPTFGYEVAVIVRHGLKRMFVDQQDVFFYMTLMNENYSHPAMPDGVEDGIIRGLYQLRKADMPGDRHVNLIGSGTILMQVLKAAEKLEKDFDVTVDVWSATSFNELARDGQDCLRWNRLNPLEKARVPYVTEMMGDVHGPIVAATDYIKNYAEQIRPFLKQPYTVLGTDGFGRSDSRANLRRFFEVDANHIAAAAMAELFQQGTIDRQLMAEALDRYEIDGSKPNPRLV